MRSQMVRKSVWLSLSVATLLVAASPSVVAEEASAASMAPGGCCPAVPEPPLSPPVLRQPYEDPAFGTALRRVVDAGALGRFRAGPEYSQLQVWNADGTWMLLGGDLIVDAETFQVVHEVDFGWPAWGGGLRWSPTEPDSMFYTGGGVDGCSGAVLMRYRLLGSDPITATRELVRCFPEYAEIERDSSYEELSHDGRRVALAGVKPDDRLEIFAYDLLSDLKHPVLSVPVGRFVDWVAVSPSGQYLLVLWGGGGPGRYEGMEAFELDGTYLDKVHTGTGHSDLAMDASGDEWLVVTNANNAYLLSDRHYLVKAKIPQGVLFGDQGNVDQTATLAAGLTVPLLTIDWEIGIHISCRNTAAPGWCAVTGEGGGSPWKPFQDEIFALYLDSTKSQPHVQRLVHHRSSLSDYWATPFATIRADGGQIAFGSDWRGQTSIDAHVIDLDDAIFRDGFESGDTEAWTEAH
ncbi:MAG: hypothetical protein MPN21_09100 [Thermoanaerobaculia bacterium]|nr:hypothetical protein [Thermoanaerobaculia bacterium]